MTIQRLTPEDFDRIVLMREEGRSYKEIALAVGCSQSAVSWHCLRLGADPPKPPKPVLEIRGPVATMRNGFPVRRYTADDDARILSMEAEGKSETEIARALGRRFNSIRRRLMTLARRDVRMEASP